jgi:hypothetical protein
MMIPLGFLGVAKPASDFELISTQVLGSSTATVTFSGLGTSAAAYKHLQLRIVAKHSADQNAVLQINGDSSANYWWHMVQGNGSASSSYGTSASWMQIGYGPNSSVIPTVSIIDILDFASTTKTKTIRTMTGCAYSATQNVKLMSGLYLPTGAVTSLSMNEVAGAYQAGSRFSLYGIKG